MINLSLNYVLILIQYLVQSWSKSRSTIAVPANECQEIVKEKSIFSLALIVEKKSKKAFSYSSGKQWFRGSKVFSSSEVGWKGQYWLSVSSRESLLKNFNKGQVQEGPLLTSAWQQYLCKSKATLSSRDPCVECFHMLFTHLGKGSFPCLWTFPSVRKAWLILENLSF